ncbi:MAG: HAMP domain-containing histidine kinase [Oscillospiraceae bacterium]|nr:HAMP domain-containing histidine kinase [Oscillospiraceae bacterium]
MATKWNNTSDEQKPVRADRVRAVLGALAFFLGVTLLLASILAVAGQIVWQRDLEPRWTRDWQETYSFRQEVSSTLRSFLTLGAGGTPGAYSYYVEDEVVWDDYNDVPMTTSVCEDGEAWSFWGWSDQSEATAVMEAEEQLPEYVGRSADRGQPVWPAAAKGEEDRAFRNDKNVLYYIEGGTGKDRRTYTNAPGGQDFFTKEDDPDYNFYLTFENGRASIRKDGQELDVYRGGVYTGAAEQWFVPGYDNFPAGEELADVTVRMAVRRDPSRYYVVDYGSGNTYYNGQMYWIAQQLEQNRQFYIRQAALFAAGALLLALWVPLRRARRLADRKIAAWTVHVWTEFRFLAVLACVLGILLPWLTSGDFAWAVRYGVEYGYELWSWDILLCRPGAVIALVWCCWLIRNDHRHNPRAGRRGLFRRLRSRDLQRPVERRVSRNQTAGLLALSLVLALLVLLMFLALSDRWYPALLLLIPLTVAAVCLLVSAWKSLGLAQDLGRLAAQVEAVRAGELDTPLVLPQDADLRATAESLNDIQAGMRAALAEQTRSERMKVELVSNVSHDLKTPLTSILSYAELLRQEELPPAAADYARIIDEKAQRLKAMVQDVFDISKAAADQLPMKLERLDLSKLLRQTLADMERAIEAAPLTIRAELPAEAVMIVADGRRLYRVFQNLIDNALRYALEGSRVYLTLETTDQAARASLRNTSKVELAEGVDFTARFVRGDQSRTDGGSGLGLSIAKSFTEACGGSFRVETVADFFTAIVEFPLSQE